MERRNDAGVPPGVAILLVAAATVVPCGLARLRGRACAVLAVSGLTAVAAPAAVFPALAWGAAGCALAGTPVPRPALALGWLLFHVALLTPAGPGWLHALHPLTSAAPPDAWAGLPPLYGSGVFDGRPAAMPLGSVLAGLALAAAGSMWNTTARRG